MSQNENSKYLVGCLMVVGGIFVLIILLNLMIARPIFIPLIALLGYAAYRYGMPYLKERKADREHREATERRRLSNEAARAREVENEMSRHRNGLALLAMFAMTDDRLSRIEIDVLESYMRSAPYRYVADMKLWIKTGAPSTNDREQLLRKIQRNLGDKESKVLADHLQMLRATKRRHAPLVEQWFDEALTCLGIRPSADPFDIRPIS